MGFCKIHIQLRTKSNKRNLYLIACNCTHCMISRSFWKLLLQIANLTSNTLFFDKLGRRQLEGSKCEEYYQGAGRGWGSIRSCGVLGVGGLQGSKLRRIWICLLLIGLTCGTIKWCTLMYDFIIIEYFELSNLTKWTWYWQRGWAVNSFWKRGIWHNLGQSLILLPSLHDFALFCFIWPNNKMSRLTLCDFAHLHRFQQDDLQLVLSLSQKCF